MGQSTSGSIDYCWSTIFCQELNNFSFFGGQTTYFQKEREIPPVPEYVAYYNMDDVRKDVKSGLRPMKL